MFEHLKLEPIPNETQLPNLRIDYFGPASIVYVKGVAIGRGVKALDFKHNVGEPAKIIMECDVDQLEFLKVVEKYSGSDENTPEPE